MKGNWRTHGAAAAALAATLCLAGCGRPAVEATDRPFLWRVEGAAKPFYVYGTIHLPDPRVTALPDEVEQALAASDVLFTELSLTPTNLMDMARAMKQPAGRSLSDDLPRPLLTRLEDYVRSRRFPFPRVNRMKVWAAMMTLGALDAQRAGQEVLDQVLMRRAREAGLELAALETVTEQVGVFEAFSKTEQIEMLEATLDLLLKMEREGRSAVEELVQLYLAGDEDILLEEVTRYSAPGTDPALQKKLERALLVDRNQRMAARIAERVAKHQDQTAVFVVGAAHCPGAKGVLALLRAKGFQIHRLGAAATLPVAATAPK